MLKLSTAFGDTETLDLNPLEPKKVAIDSLGVIRIDAFGTKRWEDVIPEMLVLLTNAEFYTEHVLRTKPVRSALLETDVLGLSQDSSVSTYFLDLSSGLSVNEMLDSDSSDIVRTVEPQVFDFNSVPALKDRSVRITVAGVHAGLLNQLAEGRNISAKTVQFHEKNGYYPESVSGRVQLKVAAQLIAMVLRGVESTYFRGTEFDMPLWQSSFELVGPNTTPYKYNKGRDVRSTVDALAGDGVAFGYYDWAKPTEFVRAVCATNPIMDILHARCARAAACMKEVRHTSLVDAYLDAIASMYLTMAARIAFDCVIAQSQKSVPV